MHADFPTAARITPRRYRVIVLALLCTSGPGIALAQTDSPASDPLLTNPSTFSNESELEQPYSRPLVAEPEQLSKPRPLESALPGLAPPDFRPAPGQLIREGAYLRSRQGRLVPLKTDGWAFVFDPDEHGQADPPMILQPCVRLTQMVQIQSARQQTITFKVDGEVFVFRGRNYLLPQFFSTVAQESAPAPTPTEPSAESAVLDAAPGEPTVEELIQQVESRQQERDAGMPRRNQSESFASLNLLSEGTLLVLRRGRVIPGPSGGWLFTQDNDIEQAEPRESALLLMPCRLLEDLQDIARRHEERISFLLSGQVYVHQDQNYLLPSMFIVERDNRDNLISAQ